MVTTAAPPDIRGLTGLTTSVVRGTGMAEVLAIGSHPELGKIAHLLLAVVILSAIVQVVIHYTPATQSFFELGPLRLADGALAVGVGLLPVTILELRKLTRRLVARDEHQSVWRINNRSTHHRWSRRAAR